jgi:DNA (cytosine-5)-methyltransferase 1
MRPLLLDLFCGAGGAATGYYQAGFDIVGVDVNHQPRYPFKFVQADALEYLRTEDLSGYCLIHASPPCQGYSVSRFRHPGKEYPMLLEPVREALQATGLPYVIENVEGAPLIDAVTLCGSQFGLTCEWPGNGKVALRRHRLFESTFPVPDPGPHDHSLLSVPVYGHGPSGRKARLKGTGHAQAERDVMRIDWMTREEINEAIPPAYTEYVGQHALLSGIGRADLHISEADQ